MPAPPSGALVLAATPIGEPRDASPRLRAALASADIIAAEDTRRLRRLCVDLDVTPTGRVVSHHDHNEASRAELLVDEIASGATVLVVTDAGMPSVSDPGYRLVAAAIAADLPVTCIPGPSAVLTALAVSGLPVDRFCFEGFLPRKAGERSRVLAGLATEPRTMVFFEAPHRLAESLSAMAGVWGPDRRAAVCRELTKTWEQTRRGTLADLASWAEQGARGEITIVVSGWQPGGSAPDLDQLVAAVLDRVASGERLKEASAAVAGAAGVSKRELYDAAIRARSAT